jgi:hypothetical protein
MVIKLHLKTIGILYFPHSPQLKYPKNFNWPKKIYNSQVFIRKGFASFLEHTGFILI